MTAPRILVLDYGIGNLGSVLKGFRQVGAEVELSGDPTAIAAAAALVLPGDGAFGATMDEIRARGMEAPLRAAVQAGTPLLGICIGMQVLFEESEEHGRHRGLGLLPGRVRRFFGDGVERRLPVPHMGWNRLKQHRSHPLFEGVADLAHVYFVHSYFCDAPEDVRLASSDYGHPFAAIVGRGNVLGLQFHPEKSQAVGLRLVENFALMVAAHEGRRTSAVAGVRA